MNKKKFKKSIAKLCVASLLLGGTMSTSMTTYAAQGEAEWGEIKSIISEYYGEWTEPNYSGAITDKMPDTALMGNGDIGVTSYGNAQEKTFLISKSDFWSAGDLKGAYNSGNKNTKPISIGGITIRGEAQDDVIVDPQLTSLALNKPVKVSSYHDNFTPDKAVNGKWTPNPNGCGWVSKRPQDSEQNGNQHLWLEVNLEEPTTFNRFVVRHDGAGRPNERKNNTKHFEVQVRNTETEEWKIISTIQNNKEDITDVILEEEVTANYVRLYITQSTQATDQDSQANPRARIQQFELYNNENLLSEIESAQIENSILYDLGSLKKVSRYQVENGGSLSNLSVYISKDQNNWIKVDEAQVEQDGVIDRTFRTQETRYIKFVSNGSNSIEGVRLYSEPSLVKNEESQGENKFREIQDIVNAEVRTNMTLGNSAVDIKTWTSATDNVVIAEVRNNSNLPVDLEVELWAKSDNAAYPVEAGEGENNTVWVTRSTVNYAQDNTKSWTSETAMATTVLGAQDTQVKSVDEATGKSKLGFVLQPETPVYIVTAIGGSGQTYDNQGVLKVDQLPEAEVLSILEKADDIEEVSQLHKEHLNWWKDYWMASYIDLDDADENLAKLEKYYYGAQYILGSTSREGELAPGLYGVWHTTDNASWSSDYHLNYNFISTFYGTYSSNRTDVTLPVYDAIRSYEEEGARRSESVDELKRINAGYVTDRINNGTLPADGIKGGILYPLGIGPWGTTTDNVYLNESVAAAYNTYPFIQYYKYTLDEGFLRDMAYPYMKKVATFFESWLYEEEDGSYTLYAGYNEGSWAKNPTVELASVKNMFKIIIEASETLGVDEEKREVWKGILDHLAPQPTAEYSGKIVYSLAEQELKNGQWVDMTNPVPGDGNIIPLESFIPGEMFGYMSSPEALQIARDTIDVFGERAWGQINNFPRIFTYAVRSRYPAENVVQKLVGIINSQLKPNLRISDGVHGVEKSGAIEAINNMLLMQHEGITQVFPNWIEDKDAKFVRLREKGAFLVSSEYKDGAVQYVEIFSEKGKPMTLVTPWKTGMTVRDEAGNIIETTKGVTPYYDEITYTFETESNQTYYITEGEETPVTKPATELTGKDEVEIGESFDITLGISDVENIYAEDITIEYDYNLFELNKVEGIIPTEVVETDEVAENIVRILAATEKGISERLDILKLNFTAKSVEESQTGTIRISGTELGKVEDGESAAMTASLSEKRVMVKGAPVVDTKPEDINGDEVIDVADLALVAYYYQRTSEDSEWEEAKKADVNKDGIVDILDLGLVAQKILEIN